MGERLQKVLSEYGIMSRRAAEKLIAEGRITVGGRVALMGEKIDPATDRIEIDGKRVSFKKQESVTILLNKPRRYITSVSDEKGRRTVMDLVEGVSARVYPVGRLDYDSEGLLLLTNDGELANRLMHPRNEKVKTYRVTVTGLTDEKLVRLSKPIEIDGYTTRPARVKLLSDLAETSVVEMKIHEGRNRQIRRMCEAVGLKVLRLKRTEIAGVRMGGLKLGSWRELNERELQRLQNISKSPEEII